MPRLHPMQNYPLLSHTAKRSQMQSAGCVMKTMMKNWCLSHRLAFQRMLWVAENIWSIVVLHPELRSESGSRLSCCAQNTRSSMCATDNVGSAVSCAQPDKVSSCCPVKDITVLVLCRWGLNEFCSIFTICQSFDWLAFQGDHRAWHFHLLDLLQ